MNTNTVLRRVAAFCLLLGLAGASAATGGCSGAASAGDACEVSCACKGEGASCVAACTDSVKASQRAAAERGCAASFSDYVTCYANLPCSSALQTYACPDERTAYLACSENHRHGGAGGGSGAGGRSSGSGGDGGVSAHQREVCDAWAAKVIACCDRGNDVCAPDTKEKWVNNCYYYWDACPPALECEASVSGCNTDRCPRLGDDDC